MAMFRKPYTTTSSVSFSFPPPTAVAGLIAAIVGLDNGASREGYLAAYWEALSGTRVAVSILSPVQWLRSALNFVNVKNPKNAPHIQVKHQFAAFPRYRIYVKGGVEDRLRGHLESGTFIFTPFLGVAYALAELEYRGTCQDQPIEEETPAVASVVPFPRDGGIQLDLIASPGVFKETVPFKFSADRALDESMSVLYAGAGERKIVLRKRGTAHVTRCAARNVEDVVAWFPEW
jgi:CRISPR-associated protein Cas5h